MKTLYFDCFAGASGNMILSALIALGVNREQLVEQIKLLDVSDFEIEFETVDRSGISAIHAEVKFEKEKTHRHLRDIEKIIKDSRLSDSVKERAIKIFTNLAKAEAKIHGIDVEKVHFHEVGAMDAIIDVVGVCVGFEMLEIEKFVCSKIHVGSGFVKMAHGKYPVPPPAVVELLQNAPVYSTEIEGELITPTGAAIIATVCDEFGAIPEMRIEKTAYGAGTRDYQDFPNVLRLIIGNTFNAKAQRRKDAKAENYQQINAEEPGFEDKIQSLKYSVQSPPPTARLLLIETNIDDLSAQTLGFVMERAFALGALDCWFAAIQMKKNRPATLISILCEQAKREVLTELLYTETTTLGVRVSEVERDCLPREVVKIETEFGAIDVKIALHNNKIVNAKPEYEQIRHIALKSKIPFKEIEKIILEKLNKLAHEKHEIDEN